MVMNELTASLLALLASYVLGATPFGFIVARIHGIDIREHGSGNIGATNVFRVLGKRVGIPVFILDLCKGLVPVLLARWLALRHDIIPDWPSIAAAIGAVLGHNFTFWLGFRGGKGIATSAGVLLALLPVPLAAALGCWLILFFTTRYVAVASIGAAVMVPAASAALYFWRGIPSVPLVGFAVLLGFLAIWRHRSNIRRLLNGTENRFAKKKSSSLS